MKNIYFSIIVILSSSLLLSAGVYFGASNMSANVNDPGDVLFKNNDKPNFIASPRFGFQRKVKGGSVSGIGVTQRGMQWVNEDAVLSSEKIIDYTFNYINSFFYIPVIKISNFIFCAGLEGSYLLSAKYHNSSINGNLIDGFPSDIENLYSLSLYDFGPTFSILYSIKRFSFRGSYYHGMNNLIKSDAENSVSLFSRNIQLDLIYSFRKGKKTKNNGKGKVRKPFGG